MSDLPLKTYSTETAATACGSGCCASCSPAQLPQGHAHESHAHWETWGTASCGALALVAWLVNRISTIPSLSIVLYALAIAAGGWPLLRGSWLSVWQRSLDMNVLMTIAIAGACYLGDWAEAASLVFLYSVAEWIEEQSVQRSRRAITSLMTLAPPRALVKGNSSAADELIEVDADAVKVNDLFIVRAGERIALDGVITSGTSQVNQAPVTGESLPVEKIAGDEVFTGTLNGPGVLEVRATRPAKDGTVARIARLVTEAEAEKSDRQRTVEKFARLYTPAIMGFTVLVAVIPPLFFRAPWHDSLYRALALLVAACPCGLVLSGPVASICALSAAARQGILIRGGAALETLADVRAIAFDKTGTLTRGAPEVTDFVALNGAPREYLIAVAGALEERSKHPLARAVVDFARSRNAQFVLAEHIQEEEGQGISGTLDGKQYRIGRSASITADKNLNERTAQVIQTMQSEGRSVAVLEGKRAPAQNHEPLAVLGFADSLRSSARSGLDRLKQQGIVARVILSGDNAAAVQNVSQQVGVDASHAGLFPADKLQAIRDLTQLHGTTAMVGDGINDAPALAQADIGIAMGAAGSDAAMEVSDVALMNEDLNKLPQAIDLARRTRSIIIQNITLALVLKFIFITGLFLNLWGSFTLVGGVIADTGATLLVTANSLRLLRTSKNNASD